MALERGPDCVRIAELVELHQFRFGIEETNDHLLPAHGGKGGHAQVGGRANLVAVDAPFLRRVRLVREQIGEDLDAGDDVERDPGGNRDRRVQDAVEAEAQEQTVACGFEVDVARPAANPLTDDDVDELADALGAAFGELIQSGFEVHGFPFGG